MSDPRTFLDGRVVLYAGDCRDVLKTLADNSIDSVVTDPPYGIEFMGVGWDTFSIPKGNPRIRNEWKDFGSREHARDATQRARIQYNKNISFYEFSLVWAKEVLRVLKPGGYIMAFSGCRTYHRMACAIEDVGFVTHPFFAWCFGSGFPKAHSVSKQIDRARNDSVEHVREWLELRRQEKGVTRKQINEVMGLANNGGNSASAWTTNKSTASVPTWDQWLRLQQFLDFSCEMDAEVWRLNKRKGTPGEAWEQREKIGEYNKLESWNYKGNNVYQTGGEQDRITLDITAPATDAAREWDGWFYGTQSLKPSIEPIYFGQKPFSEKTGAANVLRWSAGAINVGACRVPTDDILNIGSNNHTDATVFTSDKLLQSNSQNQLGRWPANLIHDNSEEVLACFPDSSANNSVSKGCAKGGMSAESSGERAGPTHGDSGSAARFFASFPQDDVQRIFYTSKAGQDDRLGSKHPTVKPLDLIQYLVRLVTPKNGVCLDLFAGTGTTGEACFREGFRSILIEREAEYIKDIERRMSLVMEGQVTRAHAGVRARNKPVDNGPLFADKAVE